MGRTRPSLNPEQMASGLLAAATGMLLVVPIVVTDIVMRHRVDWPVALAGFAVAAAPGTYIGRRMRQALAGTATVTPMATFVTVTCSSLSLTLGDLATRSWSDDAYVAALALPCVFFALSADPLLVTGGMLVVGGEIAVCLAFQHLGAATFVSLWLLFWSVDACAAGMVAPTLRRAAERFRSREALAELAATMAEADDIEAALSAGLPLVAGVVPCAAVTVVARRPGPAGEAVRTVATWTLGGIDVAWTVPSALTPQIFGGRRPHTLDGRCVIPLGYSAIGELVVVLDALPVRRLRAPFPEESVAALAATLLIGVSSLGHLAELQHQSRTDALTGLANRRELDTRLAAELARSSRTGTPLTVALLDLDGFKEYNDRFGHQAGDRALQQVAQVMQERVRGGDLVARYGGEEFCVLLPDTTAPAARQLLDDVRRRVANLQVTVSVGLAEWDGGEPADRLLWRADQALYQAKSVGKDIIVTAPLPVGS